MKNLVSIVLLVIIAIAGYTYFNQQNQTAAVDVAVEEVVTEATETTETSATATQQVATTESKEVNITTPADMSEEAQAEMYNHIMEYNQCMMKNRLEYHQQGVRAANVADKTLTACEPHLDELKATLVANKVNKDLSDGMVKTMRQRAARKLMSTIMQSMAGQAAAAANIPPGTVALPEVPAPVTP